MIPSNIIPPFVSEYIIHWDRETSGFEAVVYFTMPDGDPECRMACGWNDKAAFFSALEKAAQLLDDAEKAAGIQP